MVEDTSMTWLEKIRQSSGSSGWDKVMEVYAPFIRAILARYSVKGHQADDILQNVLTVVVRRVATFDRQRRGSFRAWLRNITVNCLRNYSRSTRKTVNRTGDSNLQKLIAELKDPHSSLSRVWNEEHDRCVLAHLLNQVKAEFRPNTLEAFSRMAIEQEKVDDVAADLGMSVNAALIARSRVMKRLREFGAELLENDVA